MKAHESTVTARGQVTIPAEVRRALGLKPRDKVVFEFEAKEKAAKLKRAPSKVQRWFGAVTPKNRPEDFKVMREEFEEEVGREAAEEDS